MKYCLKCGHPLHNEFLDNRIREVCSSCNWVYYEQLKVSAAALIEKDEKLLLLLRAYEPWKNCWYLPAGYVEADEDPRKAVVREVLEETGLNINVDHLLESYYFDDDPRGNGLLLVYKCDLMDGALITNHEVLDSFFFEADQLPDNLSGAGHKRAIYNWARNK